MVWVLLLVDQYWTAVRVIQCACGGRRPTRHLDIGTIAAQSGGPGNSDKVGKGDRKAANVTLAILEVKRLICQYVAFNKHIACSLETAGKILGCDS